MRDAQSYARLVDAKVDGDSDLALRALVPVVKGEMPAIFTVDTAAEIKGALAELGRVAQRQELPVCAAGLDGCWCLQ